MQIASTVFTSSAFAASRPPSPSSPSSSARAARTLGHQLERDRLERRTVRVKQVLHALRERAAVREGGGGPPRPLVAAIEDFGRELAELEQRLRHANR